MLSIHLETPPLSSDPLDSDDLSSAFVVSGIHLTLVDLGRRGDIRGALAEHWSASEDFTRWRFDLRSDLIFETGEPITPADVAESWRWLGDRLRERGSEDDFLTSLAGYERPGPGGTISGIRVEGHSIILDFIRPQPRLLNILGVGTYGVTHRSCRSARTGKWLCPRNPVSSGPFSVERWDSAGVSLALRKNFPADLRHAAIPPAVRIESGPGDLSRFELIFEDSRYHPPTPEFRFFGGLQATVGYALCKSWAIPSSPCGSVERRRYLRDGFNAEREKLGHTLVRSFFPLSIPGIREGKKPPAPVVPTDPAKKVRFDPSTKPEYDSALRKTVEGMGGALVAAPIELPQAYEELDPALPRFTNDIDFFTVEIDPEDPAASVRFMFLSKEGVRLPDPTGGIRALLENPRKNLSAINDQLWDDAVVWPTAHVTSGVWAAESVDLSHVNFVRAIPEIHWMGKRG